MKAIILAGGSGTRLWPLSRKDFPKQFLRLNSDRSLLQQAAARLNSVVSPKDIIVMTNNDYKFHVKADLLTLFANQCPTPNSDKQPHGEVPFHMILEPKGRNTAPAIAAGVKYCSEKLGCGDDEVIFISPSDHVITPVDRFREYLAMAHDLAAKGHIVTFGIKPGRPETGYGYIKVRSRKPEDGSEGDEYFPVDKLIEKPDMETAKRYVDAGSYYWNSGMFAFSIGTILKELQKYTPEIGDLLKMSYDEMLLNFEKMPDISIDYAVMEKSDRVVTLPMDIYWNDIGSWDSLFEILKKDDSGNAKSGDVIAIDTRETMIIGGKRLIATIGLEDCLIVETGDAILVSRRGHSQKVKDLINTLRADNRKEVSEHLTTFRPWGSYTILEEGPRYKIKRIVVNPCETLSLQKHYHRSEHWVVVRGTAKVRIGENEIFIHENESAYVPKSTLHKLENPGKVPLEIIEVQNGEYVGEDDIVRVDDIYDRQDERA